MPVSANITELDPMCEGVPVITKAIDAVPKIVMNNGSAFGGTNVAVVLKKLGVEAGAGNYKPSKSRSVFFHAAHFQRRKAFPCDGRVLW